MNKNLYVVLMAGGVGTRFWPYSRNSRPKQFLDVLGVGKTFFKQPMIGFYRFVPRENILVVTHEEHLEVTQATDSRNGSTEDFDRADEKEYGSLYHLCILENL